MAVIALCICVVAANAQDKVQALLDKAIQARGGADKLNKLKAWQTKSKGTLNIPQLGGSAEFTGEGFIQLPDKNRIELNIEAMGQTIPVIVCVNGKDAWREVMGMVMEITGPELKSRAQGLYVERLTHLTPLKDKEFTLAPVDDAKVDGKTASGIKVSSRDHADVKMYFDQQSNLLVKLETTALDPMSGKDVPVETYLSNHKAFDGIQFPTKSVIKRSGNTLQEVQTLDVKVVDQIDPKKFAKP